VRWKEKTIDRGRYYFGFYGCFESDLKIWIEYEHFSYTQYYESKYLKFLSQKIWLYFGS